MNELSLILQFSLPSKQIQIDKCLTNDPCFLKKKSESTLSMFTIMGELNNSEIKHGIQKYKERDPFENKLFQMGIT